MMEDVEFTWAGQCMETVDGLAFIGRNPMDKENVFIATGDSGMGLTHGTIAGMLLTDLILGKQTRGKRSTIRRGNRVRAAANFAKENLNVATQYLDWLTPSEVKSADEIEPGSGAVLRRGLRKIAVYRDGEQAARDVGRLSAPRLHRSLERGRAQLGLPLPRLAVRQARQNDQRPGEH